MGLGIEELQFLSRSETRVRILDELHRDGRLRKNELKGRLDASRTTIQRNLNALAEEGWVRDENRAYELAHCGHLIAGDYLDLLERLAVLSDLKPILRWIDPADLDVDVRSLADAAVTTARPGDPWAMVNRHVEALKAMDRGRVVIPLTGLAALKACHERVVDAGATLEIVVSSTVEASIRSDPTYRELHEEMLETGRYELYEYDGEVPYYLGLLDDTVQIGVDEDGEPRGLLETDDGAVYEWAERRFVEYREEATPISITELR